MINISLIGADQKVFQKLKPFLTSKYNLSFIMINTIDYELLKTTKVVFLDNRVNNDLKENLVKFCLDNSITLYIIPCIADILIKKTNLHLDDLLIWKSSIKLSLSQRFFKRLFDFIFSLLAILLLLPLMILIYLLIKFDDGGPAFYLQKRLTIKGREFILYKFRTMVSDAEKSSGAVFSKEDDERVTRIGRLLRKTRLDEILQIFNVLIGDMSIVGPRPERKFFVEKFLEESPFYQYRFGVKAGITGAAQVNCFYNSDYEDKLYFDLLYIVNYSFIFDLKLIFQTIKVFFKKSFSHSINQEDLDTLLKKKGKRIDEIKMGILELRDINEKNNN